MEKPRQTSPGNWLGIMRIMLGVLFLMTGLMKLTLTEFSSAWSIQLSEADIPFFAFNFWFVPIFEVLLGVTLFRGYYSRIASAMIIPIMSVAIYVHLVVSNPAAFPAQQQEPVIPIIVMIMAVIILLKGGGKWSLDLKSTEQVHTNKRKK